MLKKICIIRKLCLHKFIFYNFISTKVKRDNGCYLLPYKGTVIDLKKNAVIELHSNFKLCYNRPFGSKTESFLIMRKDSKLVINGPVTQAYGSTIEIHEAALVEIGSAYINVGSVILAAKKIQIGSGALISRNVFIYDSDHHDILDENGLKSNYDKEVIIKEHVWIGIKATILRGSRIGSGSVISAGSVVTGRVKDNTLSMGYPARSFMNVEWKE